MLENQSEQSKADQSYLKKHHFQSLSCTLLRQAVKKESSENCFVNNAYQ